MCHRTRGPLSTKAATLPTEPQLVEPLMNFSFQIWVMFQKISTRFNHNLHFLGIFSTVIMVFLKLANSGVFLFIIGLFKHKFYRKTVGVIVIRTLIVGVEGEHADHLTTINRL